MSCLEWNLNEENDKKCSQIKIKFYLAHFQPVLCSLDISLVDP